MTDVEAGGAVVRHRVCRILRLLYRVACAWFLAQGMAIRVTGKNRQTVEIPRRERGLQGVVVRDFRIGLVVDVLQVGILVVKGEMGDTVAVIAGGCIFCRQILVDLIHVDDTRQPAAVIPDVVNFHSDGGC